MSPPWKFNVYWERVCWVCNNPLDIMIRLEYDAQKNRLFWKRFFNFKILLPNDIHLNVSYLSVVNMKARHVCKHCFKNKHHKKVFRNVLSREINGKSPIPRSKSMTEKEVYNWFESFNRYLRRPDADEYMLLK